MISAKGFLEPGPDRRPRMTVDQRAAVLDAMSAARNYLIDQGLTPVERAGLTYAELVIAGALDIYPVDRSCRTCDYLHGGEDHCVHWKQNVPACAIEAGCDQHQKHDAPF